MTTTTTTTNNNNLTVIASYNVPSLHLLYYHYLCLCLWATSLQAPPSNAIYPYNIPAATTPIIRRHAYTYIHSIIRHLVHAPLPPRTSPQQQALSQTKFNDSTRHGTHLRVSKYIRTATTEEHNSARFRFTACDGSSTAYSSEHWLTTTLQSENHNFHWHANTPRALQHNSLSHTYIERRRFVLAFC